MLNFEVLRNPWNLVTLAAMVAIAFVAGFVIYSRFKAEPELNDGSAQLAKEN